MAASAANNIAMQAGGHVHAAAAKAHHKAAPASPPSDSSFSDILADDDANAAQAGTGHADAARTPARTRGAARGKPAGTPSDPSVPTPPARAAQTDSTKNGVESGKDDKDKGPDDAAPAANDNATVAQGQPQPLQPPQPQPAQVAPVPVQNTAAPTPGLLVAAAPAAGKAVAAAPAQTADGTAQIPANDPDNAADDADETTAQGPQPTAAGSAATPAGTKSPVAKAAGSTATPVPGSDASAAQDGGTKETGAKDADAKTQTTKTDDAKAADTAAAMKTAAAVPAATPGLAPDHGAANPADIKTGAVSANPGAAPAPQIHMGGPDMNGLAVEIAARSQSGIKQFDIRLDPPELGHVEVRLSIDATGKAQAHLSADQPQTLDLLQKDAPALTRALRDAGLQVSQGALNFSLRGQNQQAGGHSGGGRGGSGGVSRAFQAAKSIDVIGRGGSAYTSGAGLLDIQV